MIPTFQYDEAVSLSRRGAWPAAEAAWRRIVTAAPQDGEAWFNLGLALQQMNRNDAAVAAYGKVIALDSRHVLGLISRARLLRTMGHASRGLRDGERAAALAPNEPVAQYIYGVLLLDCGQPEKALTVLDKAIAMQPYLALAHYTRAMALHKLHRDAEAKQAVLATLKLEDIPDAHALAGDIMFEEGRLEECVVAYNRALKGKPDLISALLSRSTCLRSLGRAHEAKADLDRVVALQPDYAFGYFCRGWNHYALGDRGAAIADFSEAWRLYPDFVQARLMLIELKAYRCQWDDDREELMASLRGAVGEGQYFDPYVVLEFSDDPALLKRVAARAAVKERPGPRRREPEKLRIALLSPDLRDHPVGRQIAELVGRIDKSRFEIAGYCTQRFPIASDPVRERLKSEFAAFDETVGLSNLVIAEKVAAAGTAIAVDLSVYTEGGRTEIMSYRPAPVTAQWLGYPGTSGTSFIDYLIADPVVIPQGAEAYYTEKIVRLPGSFMPLDTTVEPDPAPSRASLGLPDEGVVFSAFNRANKLSPAMFARWMHLLAEVPGSVLWLNAARDAHDNLRREAAACGIDPARLVFAARVESRSGYLGLLTAADLYLDSFPYGGHATAADHLWAGVPVITAPGRAFASRVAASMLTAAGVPELIAADEEAYVALAAGLARNAPARQAFRARLIDARRTQPLFDMTAKARALENAFLRMWEARNGPPQPIELA